MSLVVRLQLPDTVGAPWCLELIDPPRNLPREVVVALDGRSYPFHAPPPALPRHPINLLWRGTKGRSQAILAAVRAVADGQLSAAAAEAVIADELTAWSQQWARVQSRALDRRVR